MARSRKNTTERGYGYAHQQAVKAARNAYVPGQPCARCGQPIWPWQPMDLGHLDGSGKQAYAGLEHRRCNRRAGQRQTSRILRARRHGLRPRPPQPWQPSREW